MIKTPNMNGMKNLTETELSFLPTEEDVLLYEQKGWYVSPIMLPESLLDEGLKGTRAFYKGEKDAELAVAGRLANDNASNNQALQNNEFVCFQKREIRAIVFHPLIAATAAILSRTTEIRLLADSLLCKKPIKKNSTGIVGWHTDKAYWPTLTSDNLLTAWIPFQDCTADMGPVLYIDESHKWREQQAFKSYYSFRKENLTDFEEHLSKVKPNYKKSVMTIKKGQVCFHNCHTIHCSLPNTSSKDRIATAVHFQDAKNQYQKVYKPNGELIKISYDELCEKDAHGNPNYKDKSMFPVLWSAQ